MHDYLGYSQYSKQLLWGVNHGCAVRKYFNHFYDIEKHKYDVLTIFFLQFFMVSQECAFPFLEMFNSTHDRAIPKLSQKVMLVVDHRKMLRNEMIMKILGNEIVKTGKTLHIDAYVLIDTLTIFIIIL